MQQLSRRGFVSSVAAGLAASGCRPGDAPQTGQTPGPGVAARAVTGRYLLRGGLVLSLDAAVGNFEVADVLIDGTRIAAVGPNLEAGSTEVIDTSNAIVMPGFVDTHRHMWQGALRNILPNGVLNDYVRDILGTVRAVMRPEDVRIGNLVTALGAINAGVTTVLDWSHIGNTPEHTDAAIAGLRESGLRAVYAFGPGVGAGVQYPQDIRRLRAEHFASDDGLLTLAMAAGMSAAEWAAAREVGASISVHAGGDLAGLDDALGPDVTYIHCTTFTDGAWRRVADTGGHVSLACPIEMEMGHGIPPIQQAIDHGIRPSLSVDVETEMPGDLFTQMRAVFTLQRMLALNASGRPAPTPLTAREVVEFATVAGARANHLDSRIGTLTPGKEADVIVLRTDTINVMPVNNVYGAIVLGMDTSNVDTVFVRGVPRKRHGQLVDVDLDAVRRDVNRSREAVLTAVGWPLTRFGHDLPGH